MISSSKVYDDNNVHPAYLVLCMVHVLLISGVNVRIDFGCDNCTKRK